MIRKYVLLIVVVLAVVGGVVALRTPTSTANRAALPPPDLPLAMPAGPASGPDPNIGISVPNSQRNDIDITVQGGHRISGPEIVRARQGEIVTFHVMSDVSDEFAIRGYETQVQLVKGASATLIVKANRAGSFRYELQKSGTALGTLEVAPR
jgi:hypothetical protein